MIDSAISCLLFWRCFDSLYCIKHFRNKGDLMEFVSHNLKYLLQLVYFTFIYIYKRASFASQFFHNNLERNLVTIIISMFSFPFFSHVTVDGNVVLEVALSQSQSADL